MAIFFNDLDFLKNFCHLKKQSNNSRNLNQDAGGSSGFTNHCIPVSEIF